MTPIMMVPRQLSFQIEVARYQGFQMKYHFFLNSQWFLIYLKKTSRVYINNLSTTVRTRKEILKNLPEIYKTTINIDQTHHVRLLG